MCKKYYLRSRPVFHVLCLVGLIALIGFGELWTYQRIITNESDSQIISLGAMPYRTKILGVIPWRVYFIDFGSSWAEVDVPPWRQNASDLGLRRLADVIARHGEHPRFLSVSGAELTRTGFRELQRFESLRILDLSATSLDDEDLSSVAAISTLETLDLGATHVTSDGIYCLVQLRELSKLSLRRTDVSDDAVPAIVKIQGLRILGISETKITATGIDQLMAIRPDIELH